MNLIRIQKGKLECMLWEILKPTFLKFEIYQKLRILAQMFQFSVGLKQI